MSTTETPCVAPKTSCGTPAGWRAGGRCPRCRKAHNDETNQYRGLPADKRDEVLTLLRAGRTAAEAAQAIGKTENALSQASARDGELRAALDGLTLEAQTAARKADFLVALLRAEGIQDQALKDVPGHPLSASTLHAWRTSDDRYDAAVSSIADWAVQAAGAQRRTPSAVLIAAAELLENGSSMPAAARAVGISCRGLRTGAAREPRLAAALPPLEPRHRPGNEIPAEVAARLRELWPTGCTIAEMAVEFGVSRRTIHNWRDRLGLPKRAEMRFVVE